MLISHPIKEKFFNGTKIGRVLLYLESIRKLNVSPLLQRPCPAFDGVVRGVRNRKIILYGYTLFSVCL